MSVQLSVTVSAGDQKLSFEIADHVVRIVEASGDLAALLPSAGTTGEAVQIMLPTHPGEDFSITAAVRRSTAT